MSKSIISINLGNFGSTGIIMTNIMKTAKTFGFDVYRAYPTNDLNKTIDSNDIIINSKFERRVAYALSYITGLHGCFSIIPTLRFLHKVSKINPEYLHLHNLHNYYINLPLLFKYIKKHNIKVIWTLHDCWAFTGQCPHFVMENCDKWKTGCFNCPQIHLYPEVMIDRSKTLWKRKKKWFTGVKDMTLVTPSEWLADLVKQSFLKDYTVKVINNGIDLDVFKPTESDFRIKYNLENKYVILGVAFDWGKRKGLDVFEALAKRLDDRFRIVLIGTDDKMDEQIPCNIITIHRTQNQKELAEIYTAADLFFNPTREENYPTVNMESIACGTPVLTFRTGGSPETLDEKTGYVVDVDDIDESEKQIIRICTESPYNLEDCLNRAKDFDRNLKFKEYTNLYNVGSSI